MKTLELTAVELPELHCVFQLTKKITFDVDYYRLSSNKNQHFSTSANEFNQPKTDYNRCGQCQNDILFGYAKKFYKKWDVWHCKPIPSELYSNLLVDIEVLKGKYNFVFNNERDIRFQEDKELSKLTPKKSL